MLGLDFFVFNANWQGSEDYNSHTMLSDGGPVVRAAPYVRLVQLLASTSMLISSFEALQARLTGRAHDVLFVKGMERSPSRKDSVRGHARELMRDTVEAFAGRSWTPAPRRQYCFTGPDGENTLAVFRDLLREAYDRRIALRLVISPQHASLLEALRQVGLWPAYLAWKRALVAIDEEEARRAGAMAFPLVDFGTYNSITQDPLPPPGPTGEMRYYWEPSHFKKIVGDMVLDRVLRHAETVSADHPDFGTLLTSRPIVGDFGAG